MYITRYVVIANNDKYSKIYAPCENSIILVSNNLLAILETLSARYEDNQIDENDPLYKKLLSSNCIQNLKSAHFIVEEKGDFANRYANAYQHVNIEEIYLHVTQECNLRCSYCYTKHNLGKGMMMSVELAEKVLSEINGVKHVVLTGGEPLLNSEINQIIESIKRHTSARISLLTNGTLIGRHMDTLHQVDEIIVSLDVGSSQNRKGLDADEVLTNLEKLPTDIKKILTVRSVISPGEENLVSGMKHIVTSMGMGYIVVPKLPNTVEDVQELPDMKLLVNEYSSACDYKPSRCGAGTSIIAIDWNGDIYPCQSLIRQELKLGSILDPHWEKQLESSNIRQAIYDSTVQKIEKCKDCDYRYMCGGGCRALSYNVYGRFDHCLEFFCDYFRSEAVSKLNKVTYVANN